MTVNFNLFLFFCGAAKNDFSSQKSKGNIPLNLKKLKGNGEAQFLRAFHFNQVL